MILMKLYQEIINVIFNKEMKKDMTYGEEFEKSEFILIN